MARRCLDPLLFFLSFTHTHTHTRAHPLETASSLGLPPRLSAAAHAAHDGRPPAPPERKHCARPLSQPSQSSAHRQAPFCSHCCRLLALLERATGFSRRGRSASVASARASLLSRPPPPWKSARSVSGSWKKVRLTYCPGNAIAQPLQVQTFFKKCG